MVIISILFLNKKICKKHSLWWNIAPAVMDFTFLNMNVQTQKKENTVGGLKKMVEE